MAARAGRERDDVHGLGVGAKLAERARASRAAPRSSHDDGRDASETLARPPEAPSAARGSFLIGGRSSCCITGSTTRTSIRGC